MWWNGKWNNAKWIWWHKKEKIATMESYNELSGIVNIDTNMHGWGFVPANWRKPTEKSGMNRSERNGKSYYLTTNVTTNANVIPKWLTCCESDAYNTCRKHLYNSPLWELQIPTSKTHNFSLVIAYMLCIWSSIMQIIYTHIWANITWIWCVFCVRMMCMHVWVCARRIVVVVDVVFYSNSFWYAIYPRNANNMLIQYNIEIK